MQISLELIDDASTAKFRIAFYSVAQRCLLAYPSVTGLMFADASGNTSAEWGSRLLVSEPLDDFVLDPGARIAFDLIANINADSREHRWVIDLLPGTYNVHFVYQVERETDWHDFLAKRSRFAAVTPIWRGRLLSNRIPFTVTGAQTENTK